MQLQLAVMWRKGEWEMAMVFFGNCCHWSVTDPKMMIIERICVLFLRNYLVVQGWWRWFWFNVRHEETAW